MPIPLPTGSGRVIVTASNEGKITNKEKALTLDILKVGKDKESPLENAEFKLYKINEKSETLNIYPNSEQVVTTNDQGKASFEKLTIGYYLIKETNPPSGYIIMEEDSFYIEVTDSGINLLTKGEGAPSTWEKNATSYGNVKTFTAASANTNAQAKVENTPGAALPDTGGPGTNLFYLIGCILTMLTSVGMAMKRRRRDGSNAV